MSNIITCNVNDIANRFINDYGGLIVDHHEYIGLDQKKGTVYEIATYLISDSCFILINYIFGGQLLVMSARSKEDIVACIQKFSDLHNGKGLFYLEI